MFSIIVACSSCAFTFFSSLCSHLNIAKSAMDRVQYLTEDWYLKCLHEDNNRCKHNLLCLEANISSSLTVKYHDNIFRLT